MQATEDHYATLGVAPKSEAVDIRAAYLALMRRFHPDRNDSPEAIERAHEIIAAFAVLGNVEKRLHYDWGRRRAAEAAALPRRRWPVMMTKALVAAALVLLVLVPLSFFAFPPSDRAPPAAPPVHTVVRKGPVQVQYEEVVAVPLVAEAPVAAPEQSARIDPVPPEPPLAAEPVPDLAEVPVLRAPREPRQAESRREQPAARAKPQCRSANAGAETAVCNNDNLAALDRNVVAFYNQSLQFAAATKRGALLDSRVGFLLRREECRSDTCLQRVHLDHLRELAAIVEKRELEPPR